MEENTEQTNGARKNPKILVNDEHREKEARYAEKINEQDKKFKTQNEEKARKRENDKCYRT